MQAPRRYFRNVAAFAASASGKGSRLPSLQPLQVGRAQSSCAFQPPYASWKEFRRTLQGDGSRESGRSANGGAAVSGEVFACCRGNHWPPRVASGPLPFDTTGPPPIPALPQKFVSFSLPPQRPMYRQTLLRGHPLLESFCRNPTVSQPGSPPSQRVWVRFKMVKTSAYHRRSRASPTGQSQKAHIGMRRLSAEYVTPGCLLVKQRRYIAWGFEHKRRLRHRKMYPGMNVGVTKNSSLVSLAYGRVKYTHDVNRDVLVVNVLPERREELLREDLWRYRTEHVASMEENRHVCCLRSKETKVFVKKLVNPPMKPLPRPKFLSRFDTWENPTLPDAPAICDDR